MQRRHKEEKNMENVKSNLQMIDLYFSKIECVQIKDQNNLGQINLNIKYDIDTIQDQADKYSVEKVLSVYISDDKNCLAIEIKLNGIFKLEFEDGKENDSIAKHLLDLNTITIMMPFLRSEVSLITTQPGIAPVMLPVVDVTKLVDGINEQKRKNEQK